MTESRLQKYLFDHLDRVQAVVSCSPLGLITDIDGTIAPIAPTPQEARVTPACLRSLDALSRRLALVAAVSGRGIAEVQDMLGLDGVVQVGSHGAEYLTRGELSVVPEAMPYRVRIGAVLETLKAQVAIPGLVWQDKGLAASIHYRLAGNPETARATIMKALKDTPGAEGLEVFEGKMVVELRPPLGLDKGHAVRLLVRDHRLRGVLFLGDDLTDVDGFRAVQELGRTDTEGLAIAVVYPDSPQEVYQSAHLTLYGVHDVERFLLWLEQRTR